MARQGFRRGPHRYTYFTCDGCGLKIRVRGTNMPDQWVPLGALLGLGDIDICGGCKAALAESVAGWLLAVRQGRTAVLAGPTPAPGRPPERRKRPKVAATAPQASIPTVPVPARPAQAPAEPAPLSPVVPTPDAEPPEPDTQPEPPPADAPDTEPAPAQPPAE